MLGCATWDTRRRADGDRPPVALTLRIAAVAQAALRRVAECCQLVGRRRASDVRLVAREPSLFVAPD